MNAKRFIVSGIVGGIVDFLLGWVFYGMLFKDIYPEGENFNLSFIFLGCMTFGFFISYLFNQLADIADGMTGFKTGAIIGLFWSLAMNFFMHSSTPMNTQNMLIDVLISVVMGACIGAAVAYTNKMLK